MKNKRLDVAVDMDDEHGTATPMLNFCRADDGNWRALDVSEISSL